MKMGNLITRKCRNYFHQPFYPITNEYCTVVLRYLWNGNFEIDHPLVRNFQIKASRPLATAAEQPGYLEVVGKLVPDSINFPKFVFHPNSIHRIVLASEALYIMRRIGPGFLSTLMIFPFSISSLNSSFKTNCNPCSLANVLILSTSLSP